MLINCLCVLTIFIGAGVAYYSCSTITKTWLEVFLYLMGVFLILLGRVVYTVYYPKEVIITLGAYIKSFLWISHILGNIICVLDEGMWDAYTPRHKGCLSCVLIVLIYLLMFVTCLSPDKHVYHEFYKNMVLMFSVLIGWSLVAIRGGSIGVYLPIVALSIKTTQNHVLFWILLLVPQMKTTTYLTQYRGALIALVCLFTYLIILVLPVIKTNLLIRRSIDNLFIFKISGFNNRFDLLWEKAK